MNGLSVFKMDKKRVISLILLFLFVVSTSSGMVVALSDSDSIPSMNIDLYVKSDGNLHVTKVIHYSFSGNYNNYRDYDIEMDQNPENLKVSFQGAYVDYTIYNNSPGSRISMSFYSDPEKITPIRNKNVNVIIEYDLPQAIKFYNDTAYFQYKLGGEEKSIEKVAANIRLKSNNSVQYWLNPSYYTENSNWQNNNLQITSKAIPGHDNLELEMAIPKNQFNKNPKNGVIVNENILSEIEKNQANYQILQDFLNGSNSIISVVVGLMVFINLIIIILLIFAPFTPLFIYLKYGREPKIEYNAEYETELPTDDPPAIVNAICAGNSKKIGVANLDGFRATILDLIDRNYLLINNEDAYSDSLLLEINPDYDPDSLWEFEETAINFLRGYEQNGVISMDLISKSLNYDEDAAFFKVFYKKWRGEVFDCLLEENNFEEAFRSKGDNYLKAFGYLGLIVSFILLKSNIKSEIIFLLTIFLLASSIISLILPQKIAGQWTPYGLEYYKRWESFKRYVKDFSLIKDYPPESVKVWNKYLIYGTALGAANGVRKAMELSLPDDKRGKDRSYLYDAADAFGYVLSDAVNEKSK